MEAATDRYYKLDNRRLSLSECWRMFPGLGFLVAVLLKLLRIPLDSGVAMRYPTSLLRVDDSALDLDGRRARLRKRFAALEEAGFRFQLLYRQGAISPSSSGLQAIFLSHDEMTAASVVDVVARRHNLTHRHTAVSLISCLPGDRYVSTTADRQSPDRSAAWDQKIIRSQNTAKLVAMHRNRLLGSSAAALRIEPGQLEEFVLELERRQFDRAIERGVMVPMSEAAVEKLRRAKPSGGGRWTGWIGGWKLWATAFSATLLLSSVSPLLWNDSLPEDPTLRPFSCTEETETTADFDSRLEQPTLLALFADDAAAARAREELATAIAAGPADILITRIGSLIVARPSDGAVGSLRAAAVALSTLGAETMLEDPAQYREVGFEVRWRESGPDAIAATDAIESYLSAPPGFYLRAPWVPASASVAGLTEEQLAARRSFHALDSGYYDEIDLGPLAMLRALWEAIRFNFGGESSWAEFERQQLEELKRRVDDTVREDPEVDPDTAAMYVAWQETLFGGFTDPDPFSAEPGADPFGGADRSLEEMSDDGASSSSGAEGRLASHLGRLQLAPDPESGLDTPSDPAHAFSAASGWVERDDDGSVALWYLDLVDSAAGLPAFLGYLCEAGAGEVELGINGELLELDSSGSSDTPSG